MTWVKEGKFDILLRIGNKRTQRYERAPMWVRHFRRRLLGWDIKTNRGSSVRSSPRRIRLQLRIRTSNSRSPGRSSLYGSSEDEIP